jgi:hypothetical protein
MLPFVYSPIRLKKRRQKRAARNTMQRAPPAKPTLRLAVDLQGGGKPLTE